MKFYTISKSKLLALVCMVFSFMNAHSQFSNSVYGRFGLGVVESAGSTPYFAMGGGTASFRDGNIINTENPASLGYLQRTLFQAGGRGKFSTLSDSSNSAKFSNGTVGDVAMAFKKQGGKWGYAAQLSPYSSTNYNVTTSALINDTLQANYRYYGTGGINKVAISTGRMFVMRVRHSRDTTVKVVHRLSLGFSGDLHFGSIQNIRTVSYTELGSTGLSYYPNAIVQKTLVSGFTAKLGVHYSLPLHVKVENGKSVAFTYLLLGGTYSPGRNVRSKYQEVSYVFPLTGSSVPRDTAWKSDLVTGKMQLPTSYTGGLAIEHISASGSSFVIAANYQMQDWKGYSATYGETKVTQELKPSSSISIGGEFTPASIDKSKNFFDRITYRAGVRTTNTYFVVNGQQLTQQAMSVGFSIPMLSAKAPGSKLHLGVEQGKFGTTTDGLIQEKFFNIQVAVSLSPYFLNQWFVTRKYD